jgi:phosphatidylinositol 4-kinase B
LYCIAVAIATTIGHSPGGALSVEQAPFKLTEEYIELLGGRHGAKYAEFRACCTQCFLHLRRHHHRIILLLQMVSKGNEHLPCFAGDPTGVLEQTRQRFLADYTEAQAGAKMRDLIDEAAGHWTTTLYDHYQEHYVGII